MLLVGDRELPGSRCGILCCGERVGGFGFKGEDRILGDLKWFK